MARDKLVYDIPSEEKQWFDDLAKAAGMSKVSLLRQVMDEFAEKVKFKSRPKSPMGK